jgi:hypothetical protein
MAGPTWEAPSAAGGASRRRLLLLAAAVVFAGALLARGGVPAPPSEPLVVEHAVVEAPGVPAPPSVPAPRSPARPADAAPGVGAWRSMADGPLSARSGHIAVPFDGRVLVWGGIGPDGAPRSDGALYDGAADQWTPVADAPEALAAPHPLTLPPDACVDRSTGCSGTVIVLGDASDGGTGTLLAYEQDIGWRRLAGPPQGAWLWQSAAWTGTDVLLLEDSSPAGTSARAALYDPERDAWRDAPTPPLHGWDGSRAAGRGGSTYVTGLLEDRVRTGVAVYADGAWSAVAPAPVSGYWQPEIALRSATGPVTLAGRALVGGSRVLSWSPHRGWQPTPRLPWELLRDEQHLAVNADLVVVWSGDGRGEGAVLPVGRDRGWRATASSPLAPRTGAASAWTGTGLLVWGGAAVGPGDGGRALADGAVFHPHAPPASDALAQPD